MKNFLTILFLAVCCLSAGGQSVTDNFKALVWKEEFDQNSPLWKQSTNADEVYIIQQGQYILYRKAATGYGLIFPTEKMQFASHKAEFKISLDDENDKSSSAGVVVMAQDDGKGAFLIEINGKKQYRISKYNGTVFKPIGDDWKKSKAINGRGESDIITLKMDNKMYDLFINNQYITSFSEVSYKGGKVGLYVAPESKVNIDYVRIYVTSEESERLQKEMEKKTQAAEDPVLTEVIKKLREKIVSLEEERDSLRVVVKNLEKKTGDNAPPSAQKLRTENKELKAEIERLKKENAALTKENNLLRKFKETIQNGEDGDIIINLTNAIETERQRVEALVEENEELNEEIKRLRTRLGN